MARISLTPLEEKFIIASTESGHFWDDYTTDMEKAEKYGVSGSWYCAEDYCESIGCKKNAVRGIAGSLVKKGIINMSFEGKSLGSNVDTWLNYTIDTWDVVLEVLEKYGLKR